MSSVFYKPDVTHEYQVIFEDRIFVCVYGTISYAWLFDVDDITLSNISEIFNAVSPYLLKSPDQYEFKIIGSEQNVANSLSVFKELGFKRIKETHRSGSISLTYLPADGKIFLKKELPIDMGSVVQLKPKIKVMVVDDSKAIRDLLETIINSNSDFELVAAACHPSEAEHLIETKCPDIIAVDLHMPGMDGISLLKKIGPKYRIPIVMISSLNVDDGPLVLSALEHGAVDFIPKPSSRDLGVMGPIITEKLRVASKVNLDAMRSLQLISKTKLSPVSLNPDKIILMGAGAGGLEVLRHFLTRLPSEIPPILIVQHIPQVFSKSFAQRMDELCPFSVEEATNNHAIKPNTVLIAPGGMHMTLIKVAGQLRTRVEDLPHVNKQKPSIDVLFNSAAPILGANAIGAILTGAGTDGSKGLLKLKEAGAQTLVQDSKSSIISTMPEAAIAIGACEATCDVESLPSALMNLTSNKKVKAA